MKFSPLKNAILLFTLIFLVSGLLTACDKREPLVYEPVNWQTKPGDELIWITNWGKTEIQTFRQVRNDDRWTSFRVDFDIYNHADVPITLLESTRLINGVSELKGQMIRLWSPQGLVIEAGEYAQVSAVFETGNEIKTAISSKVTVLFSAQRDGSEFREFSLSLKLMKQRNY